MLFRSRSSSNPVDLPRKKWWHIARKRADGRAADDAVASDTPRERMRLNERKNAEQDRQNSFHSALGLVYLRHCEGRLRLRP